MKLWELYPKFYQTKEDDPWTPWYDCCFQNVIRAETEEDARKMAALDSGAEGDEAWLDEKYSICEELLPEGDSGIIIQNVANA